MITMLPGENKQPQMTRIPRASRNPNRMVGVLAVALAASGCADDTRPLLAPEMAPSYAQGPQVSIDHIDYDVKDLTDYEQKWANPYGRLSLDAGGTLTVGRNDFTVSAIPFQIGADYSVYDHLKYIAISTQEFAVPANGSLTFEVDIRASTPGTVADRLIRGCYGAPGSFQNVGDPCELPWSAPALQGQQAGVVLNMINFQTGQLFDWFVSDNEVFALIERLPSNVTNPSLEPGDAGYVGLDKAYTQIIKSQSVQPNRRHRLAIRYSRGPSRSTVEFFLNGKLFTSVENVGVPLDVQGVPFTGSYPSYGPGEPLKDALNSFVIGHGLFSLLDAFPYQHPERPDLSVSIPMSERLFGQGAAGTFDAFRVTRVTNR
jgi:hypothetical protein